MDLVFEIGTEELPASFQKPAVEWLSAELQKELSTLNLPAAVLKTYATPRRLALIATGIPERSPDVRRTVQGPPAKAAFNEGKPTKAAEGFARKLGVAVTDLKVEGDKVVVDQLVKGASAAEALPAILTKLVSGLPFKKSMRWGNEDVAFARPVHWIGATLDGQPIGLVFGDVKSGAKTRGHRFHAPDWLDLPSAASYVDTLRKAHVLTDWQERKERVWQEVQRAAKEAGGEARVDEELLETVTGLVEEPSGNHGTFDQSFLELPPEVLVSEMRGHQKYFAVQDSAGKLLPAFVAVSNTKVVDPSASRRGYERVLRSRLSDGKFFFDEDRKTKLESRNERLKRTVYLHGLGTQWDRVERIRGLSLWLQGQLEICTEDHIKSATSILKADLATGMVGEFPDLQGVMGREYARAEGLPAEVSDAIFEHYLPRGADDKLPAGDLGALLGAADRIDQLVGIFGIGKEPTGTADPYGLRRAAIGLIRIVLHKQWKKLDLHAAFLHAAEAFQGKKPEAGERVWHFLLGRLQNYFSGDYTTFEVQMALGRASGNLLDIEARLSALRALRGKPELVEAAAAFKRIQNILQQAHDKGLAPMHFDAAALADDAERQLADTYEKARAHVGDSIKGGSYGQAFETLASLRDALARFFDGVMVMAPDAKLRDNRLALLRQLYELFAPLADFSKLQA